MIALRVWLLSATAVTLALPASSTHAQAQPSPQVQPPLTDARPVVRLVTVSVAGRQYKVPRRLQKAARLGLVDLDKR